jgi:hypothetical protein
MNIPQEKQKRKNPRENHSVEIQGKTNVHSHKILNVISSSFSAGKSSFKMNGKSFNMIF